MAANLGVNLRADGQLRFGFMRGTAPEKWLKRWHQAGYEQKISADPLPLDFYAADGSGASSNNPLLAEVLTAGGVALVRTTGGRPEVFAGQELNSVRLYGEMPALLVAKGSEIAQLGAVSQLEEFELVPLLSHSWHLAGYPAAQPWKESSWQLADVPALVELVGTGLGAALLPQGLAMQLADKKQHRVLPVAAELALPETAIWAVWLRACDSATVQDFIGVLRGRRAGSGRDKSKPLKQDTAQTATQAGAQTATHPGAKAKKKPGRKTAQHSFTTGKTATRKAAARGKTQRKTTQHSRTKRRG